MANPQGYAQDDYSTLEVAQQQHNSTGYQPVQQVDQEWAHTHSYPQVAYATDAPQVVEEQYDKTYPEAVPGQPLPQPLPLPPTDVTPPPSDRILGLKRKTFLVVLAVVLVIVVGAVVGGAVGGTVGRNKSSSSHQATPGSTPTPTATSSPGDTGGSDTIVLGNSSISAVNWTDSDSNAYRAVFWQDKAASLMMSLWDSANNSWVVQNVSSKISAQLQALPGTPLVATARGDGPPTNLGFGLMLFYLNPTNVIQQLYCTDARAGAWNRGQMITDNRNIQAGEGSQLAVWWGQCARNCSNEFWMFFEDANGGIHISSNESDWSVSSDAWASNVIKGSPLSFAVLCPDNATWGDDPSSPRIYYDTAGIIQEVKWEPDLNTWYYASDVWRDLPAAPPKLASTGYFHEGDGRGGPRRLLISALFDNGTVGVNSFDATNWQGQAFPTLSGTAYDKWSAVSVVAAEELTFYGITPEGEIHSYVIDPVDPLQWTYGAEVSLS